MRKTDLWRMLLVATTILCLAALSRYAHIDSSRYSSLKFDMERRDEWLERVGRFRLLLATRKADLSELFSCNAAEAKQRRNENRSPAEVDKERRAFVGVQAVFKQLTLSEQSADEEFEAFSSSWRRYFGILDEAYRLAEEDRSEGVRLAAMRYCRENGLEEAYGTWPLSLRRSKMRCVQSIHWRRRNLSRPD